MPYGLKDIELEKLGEVFAANERIERVVLYGSRAKGNYKPFSDVDITLEGSELTHNDLSRLSLAIDDLLLPYQFDISIFHTLKNEALIDHIRRMGITIYERKSEWKEYKLGEIASFVAEKVSVQDVRLEDYISTENMLPDKGGITIASNKPQEGSATKYFVDTILISNIRPYFKKIWYANKSGGCSNDVLCFKAKDALVYSKYLYFLLSQDTFFDYVMLGSKGCKMPRGDRSHIMNWGISLPPLPTQRRIASILSSLDDKIDLLHRENATLEQMAETLFRQWFVVEAKEEWEEGKLGDICNYVNEKIDIGNVETGDYISTENMCPNKQGVVLASSVPENGKATKYRIDDVLLSNIRPYFKKIWLSDREGGCSADVLCIRSKNELFAFFSYYTIRQDEFFDYVMLGSKGCKMPRGDKSHIMNWPIIIPPKDELLKFNEIAKQGITKIRNNNNQIQTLIQMRDGLLPRLMSGEIKI